jgi:hypothetical protein
MSGRFGKLQARELTASTDAPGRAEQGELNRLITYVGFKHSSHKGNYAS